MIEMAYAGSGVSDLVLQNKGEEQMILSFLRKKTPTSLGGR